MTERFFESGKVIDYLEYVNIKRGEDASCIGETQPELTGTFSPQFAGGVDRRKGLAPESLPQDGNLAPSTKLSFKDRLFQQLGLKEFCSTCGREKTAKTGWEGHSHCPEGHL